MSSVYTVEQGALLVDAASLSGDWAKLPINAQMNQINIPRRHLRSRRSALIVATYRPIGGAERSSAVKFGAPS